jgi:hypothetical protein
MKLKLAAKKKQTFQLIGNIAYFMLVTLFFLIRVGLQYAKLFVRLYRKVDKC